MPGPTESGGRAASRETRSYRLAELLAEEVESLGRSDKRAIGSDLKIVLEHLIKWTFQPEKTLRQLERFDRGASRPHRAHHRGQPQPRRPASPRANPDAASVGTSTPHGGAAERCPARREWRELVSRLEDTCSIRRCRAGLASMRFGCARDRGYARLQMAGPAPLFVIGDRLRGGDASRRRRARPHRRCASYCTTKLERSRRRHACDLP